MTPAELKIRGELEKDIERELEEEIKDGICRLALRLHRLYQQQSERNIARGELAKYGIRGEKQGVRKKNVHSEVNINIKMEGGTRIEIKEMKKLQARENHIKNNISKSENKERMMVPSRSKKFDWERSLRSAGLKSLAVDSKIGGLCQCKKDGKQGKSGKNASEKHMINNADKNMLLELGWKD